MKRIPLLRLIACKQMRRIFRSLVIAVFFIALFHHVKTIAESSGIHGNIMWSISTDGVLVITGEGPMHDYTPNHWAYLGSSAPWGSSFHSIVIREGVTRIGDYAFCGNDELISVTIPSSVTSIGENAFCYCHGLESLTIPNGVMTIGYDAFRACTGLKSVTILDGVTYIGHVFNECSSLTSITIPDSVTNISGAFRDCNNLTNISIPESVTYIGDYTFSGCKKLESVAIPNFVTYIGEGAFKNCSDLTNVTIPDGVMSIESSTFEGCTSLTSISIPSGVTSIESSAFNSCTSLASIMIPDGVTSIESSAFNGCTSLASIMIPSGVTSIESSAFNGCTSLTSIMIPEGVTSIESSAFNGCSCLTSITIPVSVTNIKSSAFNGCTSLVSIVIPENIVSIGSNAFQDCTSLRSVTLSNNYSNVGQSIFAGCHIECVTLLEMVTELSDGWFNSIDIDKLCIMTTEECIIPAFSSSPIVYCYEYTPAEVWADDNGYNTILMEDTWSITQIKVTNEPSYELGTVQGLNCFYIFPNMRENEITLTSSNQAVGTVSNDGTFTAISVGTTDITVTVNGKSKTFTITVTKPVIKAEDFVLPDIWVVAKSSTQATITDLKPADADISLIWNTGSTTYARVNENGVITGAAVGETTVTVTDTISGLTRTAKVYTCYPVSSVSFEKPTAIAKVGEPLQLLANVSMRTQSCVNHLITFKLEDQTAGTIDPNGIFTASKKGKVRVIATAGNSIFDTCDITIISDNPVILTLPANLSIIKDEAFANLSVVDAVRIPRSVVSIDDNAFIGSDVVLVFPTDSEWISWADSRGIAWIIE